MADLSVKYMGLNLKNPIIAGSSGLTSTVDDLQRMEDSGVAAVVMQSLFEEQIYLNINYQRSKISQNDLIHDHYSETFDYIASHIRSEYLSDYVHTIRNAKKKPIFAASPAGTAYYLSLMSSLRDFGERVKRFLSVD